MIEALNKISNGKVGNSRLTVSIIKEMTDLDMSTSSIIDKIDKRKLQYLQVAASKIKRSESNV